MQTRTVAPQEFELLADLKREGQTTIVLSRDRALVKRHSSRPNKFLHDMAKKGLLRHLAHGRYLVVGPGGDKVSLLRDRPALALLDSGLAPRRYMVTFLSALAYYGLTDHEPHVITLLIDEPNNVSPPDTVAGLAVKAKISRTNWFGVRSEEDGAGGLVRIADPERAILDSLNFPDFAGGPEIVVRALARGILNKQLRIKRLIRYADQFGGRVARRTGFLLELLGAADDDELESLRASARKSGRYDPLFGLDDLSDDAAERDSTWRLILDVPSEIVRAWASYEGSE